ncbi:aldo/keto reductase family protein [Ceratobasidium sp. AG-Ba]|nr:aldo/keto reductase family protein [Ceratobasidium sp. AG-Ba]
MPSKETRIPLIFGTMTMGAPGKNGVRNAELSECQEILDTFFSHGHTEIDTARMYAEGTTEEYLAQLELGDATVDTKVFPFEPGMHSPERLRAKFMECLQKLKREKVRIFYLHAPDRSVPFEDTLGEIDKLYKEGRFEIFGLSNYASWEVAEIVGICKAKGYVLPKVYQAMYNAITRAIEPELVPCLRKFGLRLIIYNPLAGGFFAGKVAAQTSLPDAGRFTGDSAMAKMYRARYVRSNYFDAVESLKPIAAAHGLRLTEIALRWCQHHSVLTPEDGIIVGASSAAQLEQNCADSTKGPLPEDILSALDAAWEKVGPECPPYWR